MLSDNEILEYWSSISRNLITIENHQNFGWSILQSQYLEWMKQHDIEGEEGLHFLGFDVNILRRTIIDKLNNDEKVESILLRQMIFYLFHSPSNLSEIKENSVTNEWITYGQLPGLKLRSCVITSFEDFVEGIWGHRKIAKFDFSDLFGELPTQPQFKIEDFFERKQLIVSAVKSLNGAIEAFGDMSFSIPTIPGAQVLFILTEPDQDEGFSGGIRALYNKNIRLLQPTELVEAHPTLAMGRLLLAVQGI